MSKVSVTTTLAVCLAIVGCVLPQGSAHGAAPAPSPPAATPPPTAAPAKTPAAAPAAVPAAPPAATAAAAKSVPGSDKSEGGTAKPHDGVKKDGLSAASKKLDEGPVEFRCDNMQVLSTPNNHTICTGNVVMRRGALLMCCENFDGFANADWEWERLVCKGDVRAIRGVENMWSDNAEYMLGQSEFILTGRPLLYRGKSVLEGKRIIVHTDEDRARVEEPRGRLITDEKLPQGEPPPLTGALPTRCQLPKSPPRGGG